MARRRTRAGNGPFYPVAPEDWLFADEERAGAGAKLPGIRLAVREPHPFLTVAQLFAGDASAVLELHAGYYVFYWRSRIRPDEFVGALLELDSKSGLSASVAQDSGEMERRPWGEMSDIAARMPEGRSRLIRFTGQDHSWVWQQGPLDVAGTRMVSPGNGYVVQASMANHAANFRTANKFLSISAVDGRRLAGNTHLLEGYLERWLDSSDTGDRELGGLTTLSLAPVAALNPSASWRHGQLPDGDA
jgi:hypothetical protein